MTVLLLIIKYIFISHYLFTLLCPPNMLHFNSLETFLEFIFSLPVTCTALGTCFLISPQSGPKTLIHVLTCSCKSSHLPSSLAWPGFINWDSAMHICVTGSAARAQLGCFRNTEESMYLVNANSKNPQVVKPIDFFLIHSIKV